MEIKIKNIDGFGLGSAQKVKQEGGNFVQELGKFLQWVNQEQKRSESLREAVLKGADVPMHEMVIEFEKARVALNLLIQVRNKLLEAFQELNRMQV
ncbi:MAG: flagellar hook-basal body complex protein FliE [Acidobacteria bacterium]|nr:MAG: flagellar hook-basal body complex protein FliE [Acidobacteriota bacterium]